MIGKTDMVDAQSLLSAFCRRSRIGSDTPGIQIDTSAHTLPHDSSASRAANAVPLSEITAPIPYAKPEGYNDCFYFEPLECAATKPTLTVTCRQAQFMDQRDANLYRSGICGDEVCTMVHLQNPFTR